MPQFTFNSIDEVKEFVKSLKGTRGGKGDTDDAPAGTSPAPAMPPTGGAPAFQPPGATAGFGASPAPSPFGGPQPAPEVAALVQRIVTKTDSILAGGSDPVAALKWFRDQLGPEAATASLDQIKTVFLPKMTVPALENFAKLVGA